MKIITHHFLSGNSKICWITISMGDYGSRVITEYFGYQHTIMGGTFTFTPLSTMSVAEKNEVCELIAEFLRHTFGGVFEHLY